MVDSMKSFIALAAAVPTALLLASCSSPASDVHASQPAGTESSAPIVAGQPAGYNAADVAFATDMIPHHQQAVAMSKLVPDHSTNPAVIKLAADISAAQGPEIETMKVFLVQWKEGGSDSGDGTDDRPSRRSHRDGQHRDRERREHRREAAGAGDRHGTAGRDRADEADAGRLI
jgi:uncharacterized protein (DUF305 family)